MLTEDIIAKAGINTYFTSVTTPVPTAAQTNIQIAKTIPKQIGLIYGISTYTDTVDPGNNPFITTTDASNLYLFLKDGPTEFFERIRLDELIWTFAGFPNINFRRFLPVNIFGTFDLSTSQYVNPTGIVSAAPPAAPTVIRLNMWFISTASTAELMRKGFIEGNAEEFLKMRAR